MTKRERVADLSRRLNVEASAIQSVVADGENLSYILRSILEHHTSITIAARPGMMIGDVESFEKRFPGLILTHRCREGGS